MASAGLSFKRQTFCKLSGVSSLRTPFGGRSRLGSGPVIGMKQRKFTQSSFDDFLTALDPDREKAGKKYEALRIRLVRFFEWRTDRFPDDLADETLDRVIGKFTAGEEIGDYLNYTYGVARFVHLEHLREKARRNLRSIDIPLSSRADDPGDDLAVQRLACLERCLEQLPEEERTIILYYYQGDNQGRIRNRRDIAAALGITMNALRLRARRIRAKIEECVSRCMADGRQ